MTRATPVHQRRAGDHLTVNQAMRTRQRVICKYHSGTISSSFNHRPTITLQFRYASDIKRGRHSGFFSALRTVVVSFTTAPKRRMQYVDCFLHTYVRLPRYHRVIVGDLFSVTYVTLRIMIYSRYGYRIAALCL